MLLYYFKLLTCCKFNYLTDFFKVTFVFVHIYIYLRVAYIFVFETVDWGLNEDKTWARTELGRAIVGLGRVIFGKWQGEPLSIFLLGAINRAINQHRAAFFTRAQLPSLCQHILHPAFFKLILSLQNQNLILKL